MLIIKSAQCNLISCQALGIRKRLLGDSPEVADTYHKLGKTYDEMSQTEKALIFYRESVRINKKGSDSKRDSLYTVSLDMVRQSTFSSYRFKIC